MRRFFRVANSATCAVHPHPQPLQRGVPAAAARRLRPASDTHGLSSLPHQSQSRRLGHTSCNIYSASPVPQRSIAFEPVTILLAVTVTLGAGYFANSLLYPAAETLRQEPPTTRLETVSSAAYPDMPTQTPPGRPGNLTPDQEQKLKEFWLATFEVFGVDTNNADAHSVAASGTSTPTTTTTTTTTSDEKPKKRLGLFKKKDKHAEADAAAASATVDETGDKHGQNKDFKEALASTSPEKLRETFWAMVKHDDPDALLLRFLRARKWDVHNALVMLIATMHWRSTEQLVDSDIMINGEEAAFKSASTDKDAAGLLQQLRMGKSVIHGVDKEGRPIVTVRVRLHKAGEQTEKSLERYTVYTIETCRMMLRGSVDTATIVFDMTGFSMANMDYTPVKFMIKCFEANYPESLGSVVVYKAPWVFNQIWRIIKGWLDPVVASKIHFAKNVDELESFIPRNRIIKELDGDENFEYKYIEVKEGENKAMEDKATKEQIEAERKNMVLGYERDTVAWANGIGDGGRRGSIKDQLRENYWKLDPYVRARSHYDREGLLGPGEKIDFYPSTTAGAAVPSPANDDLD